MSQCSAKSSCLLCSYSSYRNQLAELQEQRKHEILSVGLKCRINLWWKWSVLLVTFYILLKSYILLKIDFFLIFARALLVFLRVFANFKLSTEAHLGPPPHQKWISQLVGEQICQVYTELLNQMWMVDLLTNARKTLRLLSLHLCLLN